MWPNDPLFGSEGDTINTLVLFATWAGAKGHNALTEGGGKGSKGDSSSSLGGGGEGGDGEAGEEGTLGIGEEGEGGTASLWQMRRRMRTRLCRPRGR